jgi:hypothetical protein
MPGRHPPLRVISVHRALARKRESRWAGTGQTGKEARGANFLFKTGSSSFMVFLGIKRRAEKVEKNHSKDPVGGHIARWRCDPLLCSGYGRYYERHREDE